MPPSGEAELIEKARRGGTEAFEELARRYSAMLLAYARAICGDHHAAFDVVQQTLLIAYRKLDLFFPEADFGTWLRSIARREALEMRRQIGRARAVTLEAVEAYYQDPGPPETSPRRRALSECMESLEGRAGRLVRGHYFEGMKIPDLARSAGMTVAAAKQLLYRVRLTLHDCVRRRLGMEEVS